MTDIFANIGFMPHGHCYLWQPNLVWTMVVTDLLIGISYTYISISLYFLVKKTKLPFSAMFLAFGLFIAACGLTHYMEVYTLWIPAYWLSATIKIVTALASVTTAIYLFKEIPAIFKIIKIFQNYNDQRVELEMKTVELTNALEDLRKSEESFRMLVRGVQDYAIVSLNIDGTIAKWNEGATRISGYTEDEVVGRHYSIFHTPEEISDGLPEKALFVAAQVGHFSSEGWRIRKGGGLFWASVVITALKDENGKLCGFSKITRDITERKQAEDALKRSNIDLEKRVQERTLELEEHVRELKASKRQHEQLVNSIDGIVWEYQIEDEIFTFVSRQTEKLLGYSTQKWIEEPNFWDNIVHPDDLEKVKEMRKSLGKIGKSLSEDFYRDRDLQCEYRVFDSRGRIIWVRDYIRLIPVNGNTNKLCGITVDISDRKRFEIDLVSAREQALSAVRVKSEFLANMSHEIRTPLNAIIGMATVLQDTKLNEKQSHYLDVIGRSSFNLQTLIDDILDLSKLEAGKFTLEPQLFDLQATVRECIETLKLEAHRKELILSLIIDSAIQKKYIGDGKRIRQVLINLISNAIKFTDKGNVSVKILPSTQRGDDWIRFEVRDTGIGMSNKTLGKIFSPFSQADSSIARKFGGTGLGLSICRSLVSLMKGEIEANSVEGRGSTFWFEVPLEKVRFDGKLRVIPGDRDSTTGGLKNNLLRIPSNKQILIVEDHPANQEVFSLYLERLGFQADIVAGGKDAVRTLKDKSYDLIFMDCQMPGMDGYSAAREIRRMEETNQIKKIPIIAVTAHTLEGDRQKCLEAGMDDYIPKPVKMTEIKKILSRWLNGKGKVKLVKPRKKSDFRKQTGSESKWTINPDRINELKSLGKKGDTSALHRIVEIFINTQQDSLARLEDLVVRKQFSSLYQEAHRLKSACSHVGADVMAEYCQKIESLTSVNSSPSVIELEEIVCALKVESEKVFEELAEIIDKEE